VTRLRAMRDDADEHCWRQREEGVINEAVNQVAFMPRVFVQGSCAFDACRLGRLKPPNASRTQL